MRLNLNDIDIDEVQEAMFRRRPRGNEVLSRYREPYIIDRVIYLPRKDIVRIFYYEDEGHQKMGKQFQPGPVEVPLNEFTQISRMVKINKII